MEMNGKPDSWIFKAIFLGVVFAISVLVIKPVGVSTQFSMIGGMIHSVFDPSVITEDSSRKSGYTSTNAYYEKVRVPWLRISRNRLTLQWYFCSRYRSEAFGMDLGS